MEIGKSPRITSSRKRITYKPSEWRIHQFEIWSGELVCKVAALRVDGALLLWVGGNGAEVLTDVALGMPAREPGAGRVALASTLLGAEGAAAALARRLSAALARPVYVCSGLVFDRFTMPLVERGLMAEIKTGASRVVPFKFVAFFASSKSGHPVQSYEVTHTFLEAGFKFLWYKGE